MNIIPLYIKRIFEFADSRADAIQDLRGLSKPYTDHVCKLFLWGDQNQDWRKDWTEEIYNYLTEIADIELKGNKRFRKEDYMKFFFFKYMEDWEFPKKLNSVNRRFCDKNKYPKANYVNTEKAYEQYKKFVESIIDNVVQNKVFYEDVKQFCDKYLTEKSVEV